MSVWVIVGGQFGSEGKGKIAAFIALKEEIDICIRCGGPNSGHSFIAKDGTEHLVRQLPTGFIRPEARLLIPAGALIDLEVLKQEIDRLDLDAERVGIDRNAMVIEPSDRESEAHLGLHERLSSTLCGVGSAVSRRALRVADAKLARDVASEHLWLRQFLTNVSVESNEAVDKGKNVLVEGTQGFGLSVYHADQYPKATSRDTSASGFLSEVGLSPMLVSEIVLVLRTFPIRVAGAQAGTLKEEISWDLLQSESGYPHPIHEITSVTRRERRVGRFDWELAAAAVRVNRPTRLAVNGLDYLSYQNRGVIDPELLTESAYDFLARLERELGVPVRYWCTGPEIYNCSNLALHSKISFA